MRAGIRYLASPQSIRLMHGVGHQARLERRRVKNAKKRFVLLNIVLAIILFLDYAMGLSLFTAIAPEIGNSKLSAAVLALIFPVAVIALHFRIADTDGKKIETRLRRLAGIGIFIFLLGASSLIAAIMFDGAEGLGASFVTGMGIVTPDFVGGSQQSASPLLTLPPILFFFAMGFGLILTFYASHRILVRLEEHYEIFSHASNRPQEVGKLVASFDALCKAHGKLFAQRQRQIKKLPRDPEMAFARIVSAGVHKELHQHKLSLRHFSKPADDDVLIEALARKSDLPDDIKTREMGQQRLAEIKDAMRPFAVLAALDAIPPKDEE